MMQAQVVLVVAVAGPPGRAAAAAQAPASPSTLQRLPSTPGRSRPARPLPLPPQVCTVPATQWKRDLELLRQDKHRSRELACQLFPAKAGVLQRVKDHGRAEALLLGGRHVAAGVDGWRRQLVSRRCSQVGSLLAGCLPVGADGWRRQPEPRRCSQAGGL
jgi:hypothetical protein